MREIKIFTLLEIKRRPQQKVKGEFNTAQTVTNSSMHDFLPKIFSYKIGPEIGEIMMSYEG